MQSSVIFLTEFQTEKSRFLRNFELSDGGISENATTTCRVVKEWHSILKLSKSYSMYESRETTSQGVLPGTGRNQKRTG